MARIHKIEKYGIGAEVNRLREEGKSYKVIADHISSTYFRVKELKYISQMSVKRWLESQDTDHMRDIIEKNDDPDSIIEQEFNTKMIGLLSDSEDLKKTTNKLMQKALDGDETIDNLVKLIKAQNSNLDTIRKNLVSLREFTETKIMRPQQTIIFEKKIEVKDMLLDFQRVLCSDCRRKVNELMLKY